MECCAGFLCHLCHLRPRSWRGGIHGGALGRHLGRVSNREAGEERVPARVGGAHRRFGSGDGISHIRVQRDAGHGSATGQADAHAGRRGRVGDGVGDHDRGTIRAAAVVFAVRDGRHCGSGVAGGHGGRALEAVSAPVPIVGGHSGRRGFGGGGVVRARRVRPRRHRVQAHPGVQDGHRHLERQHVQGLQHDAAILPGRVSGGPSAYLVRHRLGRPQRHRLQERQDRQDLH